MTATLAPTRIAPWSPGSPVRLTTQRFDMESYGRLRIARETFRWTDDAEIMALLGYPVNGWTMLKWYKTHRKYDNRRRFYLAIRPKGKSRLIGFEAAEVSMKGIAFLTVAIGDRDWWGKGVVVETRAAFLDFLFGPAGCRRAWGTPAARNFSALYNYRKLGFRQEGILRAHGWDHRTGTPRDSVVFGLLGEEWRAGRPAPELTR